MALWYKHKFDNRQRTGEIQADIIVPADSPWFDGHFPDAPVLPGLAQVGMARDLLHRVSDHRLPIRKISRVRFKRMIRPEQPVTLTVTAGDDNGNCSFRIFDDQGLICSGMIQLGQ